MRIKAVLLVSIFLFIGCGGKKPAPVDTRSIITKAVKNDHGKSEIVTTKKLKDLIPTTQKKEEPIFTDSDFPKAPILDEVKSEIISTTRSGLKDPSSAKFEFDKFSKYPLKAYVNDKGIIVSPGWVITFYVNGKNSYGGYTGKKRYLAFFLTLPKSNILSLLEVFPLGASKFNIRLYNESK